MVDSRRELPCRAVLFDTVPASVGSGSEASAAVYTTVSVGTHGPTQPSSQEHSQCRAVPQGRGRPGRQEALETARKEWAGGSAACSLHKGDGVLAAKPKGLLGNLGHTET